MFEDVTRDKYDVAVVGGGLAGLIAAVLVAKQGRSVVLFEKSKNAGGRAMTTVKDDLYFNLGPRALYLGGDAHRLLKELQIPFHGAPPNGGTPLGYYRNREYRLPVTLSALLTTGLLSIREKWRLSQFLKGLPSINTAALHSTTAQTWLAENFGNGALSHLLGTFFRLTTYAGDLHHLAASAAIDQLRLALKDNVMYVDGGWQSLVDGLRNKAQELGVSIGTSSHVSSVEQAGDDVLLTMSNGDVEKVNSVILAIGPQAACSLLHLPTDHELAAWTERQQPVRAACLDVALAKLTRPMHRFALGLDLPLYLSVHSAAAQLGPAGVAVIHVMKYLPANTVESARTVEQELEQMLDRVQPGWRAHLLTRRMLPLMTVAHSYPEAQDGGVRGRPSVAVAGYSRVFVAGDWVGPRGQLADAAAASAEDAAQALLMTIPRPVSDLQNV